MDKITFNTLTIFTLQYITLTDYYIVRDIQMKSNNSTINVKIKAIK